MAVLPGVPKVSGAGILPKSAQPRSCFSVLTDFLCLTEDRVIKTLSFHACRADLKGVATTFYCKLLDCKNLLNIFYR